MMRRLSLLLSLFPWLLFGQGAPRASASLDGDRAISAARFEGSANLASRVAGCRGLARPIGATLRPSKRPVRHAPPLAMWVGVAVSARTSAECAHARAEGKRQAHRPKRLTIPHDATAPPVRQS